jgi:hypothetical protein
VDLRVIPADAGIQLLFTRAWMPAFAGMTFQGKALPNEIDFGYIKKDQSERMQRIS